MARVVDRALARVAKGRERGRRVVRRTRVRWAWFDHLIRTFQRYQVTSGDRLAGAVTYFAFLSFFPLIALAYALVGYVVTVSPGALDTLQKAIEEQLPGLAGQLSLTEVSEARVGAGIIGLLGLLYSGLGAVDALRQALREIWLTTRPPLNFFVAKLRDLLALVMVGATLLVSVGVGGAATGATAAVAGWLGLSESPASEAGLWGVGLLVSVAADTLVFLVVLGWLAEASAPFRVLLRGSLFGAVGFGVLKQVAALVLGGTLGNPVYGTFAVIVGLLVWINLSARIVLYAAAWTATADMGPPPEPTPLPSTETPTTGSPERSA
ncbi:YihY/virulence factor BrkB family protein [Spongiactinospora sp. TRM90649]|uniref:YihY/virulence factor BrkB family protein n=1 Tax=Spongiactinospora sp. TRM90649 TaxID=3031114 RepID=UPI0023F9AE08|nr:YihY/virulence factor BrkB family protein [Spongiactinospora sp. TRM90649]MDF5751313.1 YihY/virulence factor BrkB family protein [Spongiactinospora sp. TRM90649]